MYVQNPFVMNIYKVMRNQSKFHLA